MKKILLILIAPILLFPLNVSANSLAGRILLQVEKNGEAYYYHPDKLELFYLGRPADAFSIMREEGIGISNADLLKIPVADTNALKRTFQNTNSDNDTYDDYIELINGYNPYGVGKLVYDSNFSKKNSGKIFLQVQNNGEAWYINPLDLKRYFLGRPSDAFEIMRTLGLGISNHDLEKIDLTKVCTAWTYSDWNACANGKQIRQILSSYPDNCLGGDPILIQNCSSNSSFNCGDEVEFEYNNTKVIYKTVAKNNLCWMDRNLGASRSCESYDDSACFGDLFQWGRSADGHQLRSSQITNDLSSSSSVDNNKFIIDPWPESNNGNWLKPYNNDLWQAGSSVNNPCPPDWRLPDKEELKSELDSWPIKNNTSAFNSILKWPNSGYRYSSDGQIYGLGERGLVWSSSIGNYPVDDTSYLFYWIPKSSYNNASAFVGLDKRANGFSVRCVRSLTD